MVRKLIIDSVCYWAEEYKIDGFRFDLMGLIDIPTINEIRMALNSIDTSIMMYGEGWTGGCSPLPDYLKSLKCNVRQLPGTGVFNDDLRDGLRGHVFHAGDPGFASGGPGKEESVKFGIVGACHHDQVDYHRVVYSKGSWAAEPAQSINYAKPMTTSPLGQAAGTVPAPMKKPSLPCTNLRRFSADIPRYLFSMAVWNFSDQI